MDAEHRRVWDYLLEYCFGRARARTKAVLAAELGVSGRRIERAVQYLRGKGKVIGSACDSKPMGYFAVATEEERAVVKAVQRHRIGEMYRTLRALERAELPRPVGVTQRRMEFV